MRRDPEERGSPAHESEAGTPSLHRGALRLPGSQPPAHRHPGPRSSAQGGQFPLPLLASWGVVWNSAPEASPGASWAPYLTTPSTVPGTDPRCINICCHSPSFSSPGRPPLPPLGLCPASALLPNQLFCLKEAGSIAGTGRGAMEREATHPRSLAEGTRERKQVLPDRPPPGF